VQAGAFGGAVAPGEAHQAVPEGVEVVAAGLDAVDAVDRQVDPGGVERAR